MDDKLAVKMILAYENALSFIRKDLPVLVEIENHEERQKAYRNLSYYWDALSQRIAVILEEQGAS